MGEGDIRNFVDLKLELPGGKAGKKVSESVFSKQSDSPPLIGYRDSSSYPFPRGLIGPESLSADWLIGPESLSADL